MTKPKMNYRQTLNLPKTHFSMKANLVQKEPQMLKTWKKKPSHFKRNSTQNSPSFVLHDGPPYANGNIHMGHALNKILKDIINRFHSMQGYACSYIPGWDCHGLPIEHQVLKLIRNEQKELSLIEKRHRCRRYAGQFVKAQKKQFERLGIQADWDHSYLTMSFSYEAAILEIFAKLVERNFIYKDLRPIHWCGSCETALAEAEIEYKIKESDSIWVKFPCLFSEKIPKHFFEKPLSILVWTTTPWTISSNLSIAVHPELNYVFIDIGQDLFICAESRLDIILKKKKITSHKIVHQMKGKDLNGIPYAHPFKEKLEWIHKDRFVFTDSFVSATDGTGCVHIAPAHGEEDFLFAKKYKIHLFSMIDQKLCFTQDWPEFAGKNIFQSNQDILKKMKKENSLYDVESISHSYPHCWRCHNPIVFRTTKQWFMDINHDHLKERTLELMNQIKWIPSWGQTRLSEMIKKRPSWCLSRQRFWGVPIPAFYCTTCNKVILEPSLIRKISQKVAQKGCDIWFTESPNELGLTSPCPSCGGNTFSKEKDILDVWFDSGCSYYHLFESNKEKKTTADLYLEGSDQHRGWFQSSLLLSMATANKAPFQNIVTHNFVVDINGSKMSKSLGNVIDPESIIKDYGADIVRLFVASSDYSNDIKLSQEIIEQKIDAYRKIRNTCRFLLSNTFDFDDKKDKIPYDQLRPIDRWALSCLQNLIKQASLNYQQYEFHKFYKNIYHFSIVDMSSFYLNILKDVLYTFYPDSLERRSAQTVMVKILNIITRLMAPILVFTAEELWSYLPQKETPNLSVHLQNWPKVKKEYSDIDLEKKWNSLRSLRDKVYKQIENLRKDKKISDSLEVSVILKVPDTFYDILFDYKDSLEMIFIVSSVVFEKSKNLDIIVFQTKSKKCLRCWMHHKSVGNDCVHVDLCSKCCSVLKKMNLK